MHQAGFEGASGIQAPTIGLGLWYDAERLILEGIYLDELSAYRARRSWIKTFERNFLLEELHDFKVGVVFDHDEERYHVKCTFTSACGRYAFWRLTHHQAPEVQLTLETAHLPQVSPMQVSELDVEPAVDLQFQSTISSDYDYVEKSSRGLVSAMCRVLARKFRKYARKASALLLRMCDQ